MGLGWMDVSDIPFQIFLLFEPVQLSWLPSWIPEKSLALALKANPAADWYYRHACPELVEWLDRIQSEVTAEDLADPEKIRAAEVAVLRATEDFVVYALDPSVYDRQPFLEWEEREMLDLTDFSGKTIIDVGTATGKQAFCAANLARVVYAVEPVGNLRKFLRKKARQLQVNNLYAVDGLITELPFPDGFADIVTCGHVYGDDPQAERMELERVVKPGGMVILIPGNNDVDNDAHAHLVEHGYQWKVFIEPPADRLRKYWKTIPKD